MKKILKDKQLIAIIVLCLISAFFYLKTNDDPLMEIIRGSFFESGFYKFETGNSLMKDISIGILVSSIFWLFNIYLPEKKDIERKKIRLSKALKLVLESFDMDKAGDHYWDKHYIHCSPLSNKDISLISEVKSMLLEEKIYGTCREKFFYEICHESSQLYYFLSISASEISPEHGELWDSITRSVRRVSDIYPAWCERRKYFESGVDFSNGELRLNLLEFLESLERWIELNK